MTDKTLITSMEQIESKIFLIRSQKVMLDADLAELYGVETKVLNQAVKRNIERFPEDFMFQLDAEEVTRIMNLPASHGLKSQFVTSNNSGGRGGRRSMPYAFTEQGVSMLSSVLRSTRAIQVNIEIMRAFVQLRQMLSSNAELARRLAALEKNHDIKFKAVFEAIHELMTPPTSRKKRPIGFAPWEND